MRNLLRNSFLNMKNMIRKFVQEENGDTNIIAIILIIIVIIAVVAIFRDRLIGIVNALFDIIEEKMKGV